MGICTPGEQTIVVQLLRLCPAGLSDTSKVPGGRDFLDHIIARIVHWVVS